MIDRTQGRLEEIRAFAFKTKQTEQLNRTLNRLEGWEKLPNGEKDPNIDVVLFTDFAPYSIEFAITKNGKPWLNGGMIYHGQHDAGGNGGAPTFSVNLEPVQGWSIHM